MRARAVVIAAAVACAAAAAGCEAHGRFWPSELGQHFVEVARDRAVIQHGPVGAGRYKGDGTWVLVDAVNTLGDDLVVTLGGDLVDARGRAIAHLNEESLRIPAGGQRTFALVHHLRAVPEAAGADIRVTDSRVAPRAVPVPLSDQNIYRDGDRVVVAAHMNNPSDREVIVLVVAGFYDAGGRLMKRPFSVVKMPPGSQKPARFVGPDGSASGYLFVADQAY